MRVAELNPSKRPRPADEGVHGKPGGKDGDAESEDDDEEKEPGIFLKNYPVVSVKYNPAPGKFFIPNHYFVAAQLPSGAARPSVRVIEGGMKMIISYDWCSPMYDINHLMSHLPAAVRENIHHPLMGGTRAVLDDLIEDTGDGKGVPRGAIEVDMPFPVQSARDRLSVVTNNVETPTGFCLMVKVDAIKVDTNDDLDVQIELPALVRAEPAVGGEPLVR